MKKFYSVLLFSSVFAFLGGCDLAEPKGKRASSGDGRQVSTGTYLERRNAFETKLVRKGPAPQEWEDEKPERFVREIRYPSGNLKLKASLYIPRNDEQTPRPALVFCHGGFANGTNELLCVGPFLNGDYVVMGPSWRGENGNPGHFELMYGEVDDAVNAVRWLAEQPFVDPDRIYMFGHSVGGGISSLASLMDDVPLRHSGSSGGLYPVQIFRAWSDITPFNYRDKTECALRLLDGNTAFMQRKHYAYLGKEDYDETFHLAAKKYHTGKVQAPQLEVILVPGDHFTSFDGAVKKYFDVVQADRKN